MQSITGPRSRPEVFYRNEITFPKNEVPLYSFYTQS